MDKGQPTTDIAYYQSKDKARPMEIQGRCVSACSIFEFSVKLRQRSLFSKNRSQGRQTGEDIWLLLKSRYIQTVRLIGATTTKLTFKISRIAKHAYGISIKVRSRWYWIQRRQIIIVRCIRRWRFTNFQENVARPNADSVGGWRLYPKAYLGK